MSEVSSSSVWNDDGPQLIDTSDAPSPTTTATTIPRNPRTPPPLPSSRPVGAASSDEVVVPTSNGPVTGNLIDFESEEERAATIFNGFTRPDNMPSELATTNQNQNNKSMDDVMRDFLKEESGYTPEYFMDKFYQVRADQDRLRLDPGFSSVCAIAPQHYARNRYRDILPYDHNRVEIKNDGENSDGYMNASFVELPGGKTRFIAAQAPLPSTLDEWWEMIDEHKVTLIVILCKLIEMGKIKCERYWPEEIGKSEIFGQYEITLDEEKFYDDDEYLLRKLSMCNSAKEETRVVYQLHYREWPDHGCPSGEKQLLNMIEEMARIHTSQATDSPILVHCSAGVGRTGTIIAINHIREQIEAGTLNSTDVYSLVMSLRKQRASMVQTQDQYQFVHRCISAYCRQRLGITEEPKRIHLPPGAMRSTVSSIPDTYRLISPPTPTYQEEVDGLASYSKNLEKDEQYATSVPDFPDEPPAPLGAEDLGSAAF